MLWKPSGHRAGRDFCRLAGPPLSGRRSAPSGAQKSGVPVGTPLFHLPGLSQNPRASDRHEIDIKFPHIEVGDVLPVQIHHVPVGDAPFPEGSSSVKRLPHLAESTATRPSLRPSKYGRWGGHVQRELAVLGLLTVGHDTLIHHAGIVVGDGVPLFAGRGGQVRHRRQKVRIFVTQTL